MLPVLLTSLSSPEQVVRQAAMTCIKTVRRCVKEHTHAGIMKKLLKQEEEILVDGDHIVQV